MPSSIKPKLTVVIHTEEEFAWGKGFYRSNTKVTHGQALITSVKKILDTGAKVVLAMDYAFVDSKQGQQVIQHFYHHQGKNIEFASHVHPWVNPPFTDNTDLADDKYSFPGNLPRQEEYAKLKCLTELIEEKTGNRPLTYLAGRFGIGKNSDKILQQLGYKVDLSISSYVDMSNVQGPDFSQFNNKVFVKNGLTHIPHTAGIVSILPFLSRYLNRNPQLYGKIASNPISHLIGKILRIQRLRLSPEDYQFSHMKKLTLCQMDIHQQTFVLSFHSPTVAPGNTNYVQTTEEQNQFMDTIVNYLNWFNNKLEGDFFLCQDYQGSIDSKV